MCPTIISAECKFLEPTLSVIFPDSDFKTLPLKILLAAGILSFFLFLHFLYSRDFVVSPVSCTFELLN